MTDLPKRKVLIADDEPVVRHLLRVILSKDYEVIEAQNGKEAVEIALDQRPDLVVLDMIMPQMDGLTACAIIKKTTAIPVVMVSAVAYDLNKNLAQNGAGASAYLTKPFTGESVIASVAAVLAGNQPARELWTATQARAA